MKRDSTVGEQAELQVHVIETLAELEGLRPRWEELEAASVGGTVFAGPSWVMTWFRYYAPLVGPHVVTVWRGDELVGLAPFSRFAPGRAIPFQLLLTAGAEHGYYGEPLLGTRPEVAARAIADHLAHVTRSGTVAVNLRRLWTDAPMHRAVTDHPGLSCRPMAPPADSAVISFDLLDDTAAYLRRLAKDHSIPRRGRRLAERFDTVDYRAADADVDAALDDLQRMLSLRWAAGAGPPLFATPRRAAFTRAAVHELSAAGGLRISSLVGDERRLAISLVFVMGDWVLTDSPAFDSELATFGPGQRELYELVCHAHEGGAVAVDLSAAAGYAYKRQWFNTTYSTQSVSVVAAGRRGALARVARRVAMSRYARRRAALDAVAPN